MGRIRRFRDEWARHLWIPLLLWLGVTTLVIGMLSLFTARSKSELADEFQKDTGTAAGIIYRSAIERQQALLRAVAESLLADSDLSDGSLKEAAKVLGFEVVAVTDGHGVLMNIFPPAAKDMLGQDLTTSFEHIRRAVDERRPVVSLAPTSPSLKTARVSLAVPYSTGSGNRVIAGAIPLAGHELRGLIEGGTGLDILGFYLVDRDNNIVVGPTDPTGEITPLAVEAPLLARAMRSDPSGFVEVGDASRFYSSAQVGDTGWRLVTLTPSNALYGSAILDEAPIRATLIVLVLTGLATAVSIARRSRHRWLAIAQTKSLNRDLLETNRRLKRANADMEGFTYSVSHDLRAPLRAMSGFSEALLEDGGDALGEVERDHAERIVAASHRMSGLIDALLALSRLSRQEIEQGTVDLSLIAQEIAEDIRRQEPGRQAVFHIQAGISALGDRRLLEVALRNLFENAWKFTSRNETAHISFSSSPLKGDEIECAVADDGVGFDARYSDKLFQPFQRLHRAGDFPGTGIGLATVKRIIERNGGSTWAVGEVGRGASIHFTLPLAQETA